MFKASLWHLAPSLWTKSGVLQIKSACPVDRPIVLIVSFAKIEVVVYIHNCNAYGHGK